MILDVVVDIVVVVAVVIVVEHLFMYLTNGEYICLSVYFCMCVCGMFARVKRKYIWMYVYVNVEMQNFFSL